MKKSQLKHIIKEEIQNSLKEKKLKPGSHNIVVTGTFEIRAAQDFGSTLIDHGPFRVQLLLNGVPTGPSFTVRNGKVISTYGGDLNSYQDIIAS